MQPFKKTSKTLMKAKYVLAEFVSAFVLKKDY